MHLEMGSRMTHMVYHSMNYNPYKIIIFEQIMQICPILVFLKIFIHIVKTFILLL